MKNTLILRGTVALILIIHGAGGMFNGGVNAFGTMYLDKVGFAPFGVALAWAVKLSHLIAALSLLLNRYVKITAIATILILITGIVMIHSKDGWFVVGGGRNGVEYNVLLIAVLVFLIRETKTKL